MEERLDDGPRNPLLKYGRQVERMTSKKAAAVRDRDSVEVLDDVAALVQAVEKTQRALTSATRKRR